MTGRRAFLKFLAASPLLAGIPSVEKVLAQAASVQTFDNLIANAGDALDVFDLERVAQSVIPPAHWGYMATGVDGEDTLRANREAFSRYQLRVRRFVDVSKIDMSVDLFGARYTSPILLCPVGGQKAFHPEGEVAVARAAKARGHLQILSTATSSAIEDVTEARDAPIWYQLYTTTSFDITTRLVKRAEVAGCPVVAVTVDLPAGRNTVTETRAIRLDTRNCASCHAPAPYALGPKSMFRGIDTTGIALSDPSLTWDFIKRLKDVTTMKVLIKGLETREDAALALEHGADGIIVSNHGGRATETNRGTLDALAEVAEEIRGRIPVLVDSGVRRGTDVFKALALGATAVGIGRPYVWGLGAFGQAGVDRVLEILNTELRLAMVGCGTRSLREIMPSSIMRRT